MRTILAGCLVLVAGCGSTELTREGMMVRSISEAPSGCQIVGTIHDAEGGGLRSFESNRAIVQSRLRNEAARIGGNTLAVVSEERGDTEEGKEHFTTGVPGVATPAAMCTNCVLVTARVFSCAGAAAPVAVQKPTSQPQPDCDHKPVAVPQPPPVPVAPPPAAPAAAPPTYVAPAAPTIIIVLPPPPMAPPPQVVPQAPQQDDYHR